MRTAQRDIVRPRGFAIGALLAVAICFSSTVLDAQTRGKISGKVVDKVTGSPLPGVNVLVVGTSVGAATDLSGEYFIANLPIGTYDLRVTYLGHREVIVSGVRVRIDRTTTIDVEMEETVLEIGEPVTVVASRPLVERDNTSSSLTLEATELEVRPTSSFTEVLASMPGVDSDGGELRIRGGTLDEVAFMVDGARARNPLDQSAYTNFNLSSIQEMQVITGSFNAEYGEAQSGVINIVTKEGGDRYNLFIEQRYEPAGKKHWGPAHYDYSTDYYWENSHARHLQWWIDHPEQWVDPSGVYGNDPNSAWTPEQAYQDYLATHQPLSDYTERAGSQTEVSLGGPFPFFDGLSFFVSGRYRTQAPIVGNSYRNEGRFLNLTAKVTYPVGPSMKLQLSGFYGTEKTSWGIGKYVDDFYETGFRYQGRYAFYDYAGLPESSTDGQTLRFSHVLDEASLYEIKLTRVHAFRKTDVLPDDPSGWDASGATTLDHLRAVDANGNPVPGGYSNPIGYNTLGYYFRFDDKNTDWTLDGAYSDQITKNWQLKSGFEFSYYNLDHFNESKQPSVDDRVYKPYQGAFYAQNKLEFGGFIMNIGLRYDFYNPNDTVYLAPFDPLNSTREASKTYSQLSPRLGIAHPIDESTVLHFSYGHFFQRGPFGDYGEGYEDAEARGSLTTALDPLTGEPVILGNRSVKPQKTVAFEVGIERNFLDVFVVDVTGYYKDITNTIRIAQISDPDAGISYRTNANGNYADIRGLEISLRKRHSHYFSGYVNFSTKLGVTGRSGDPRVIYPDRRIYGTSGDFIEHDNPRLKAALFFSTPVETDVLFGLVDDVLISVEYSANFPNTRIRWDSFRYSDATYTETKLRRVDENVRLKLAKGVTLFDGRLRLNAFVEVDNLFNDKWVNFSAVEKASQDDQKLFIQSEFRDVPTRDVNGVPISDIVKYRNFPRSIVFGISANL